MGNVLVMGGFTESKRVLEPVAEAAVKLGFGDDAEVLTLRDALRMDYERLRKLMAGKNVTAHSAALMAVPDATQRVNDAELPAELAVIAAPEPKPARQLADAAISKTKEHLFGESFDRRASRRVVAGNFAEAMAHPLVTSLLVPDISRFSARAELAADRVSAERRLGYFMMSDDEFYADQNWTYSGLLRVLGERGHTVAELSGKHDELLVDPEGVLRDVLDVTFESEYAGPERFLPDRH